MGIETDCSPKFQIYESNTEPHSYAVNAKFGGTSVLPQNNMIVSVGSTFEAAFRRFRGFFEAKAHVAWEDRIRFAHERDRLEQARSEGRSVSTKSRQKFREVNRDSPDFEKTPFHYHAPRNGPVGLEIIKMPSSADASSSHKQDLTGSSVGANQAERQDSPQRPAGGQASAALEAEENFGSDAAVHGNDDHTQPKASVRQPMDQSPAAAEAAGSKKRARTTAAGEEDQTRPAKASKL
jgi:hypothetical protein